MSVDVTQHDHRRRRCPRLGHEVSFAYCREPAQRLPCRKILDCWFETFDVDRFVRAVLTDEEVAQVLAPPKDRMLSILEIIERAKRTQKPESED